MMIWGSYLQTIIVLLKNVVLLIDLEIKELKFENFGDSSYHLQLPIQI